jgi:hypothetical protein
VRPLRELHGPATWPRSKTNGSVTLGSQGSWVAARQFWSWVRRSAKTAACAGVPAEVNRLVGIRREVIKFFGRTMQF